MSTTLKSNTTRMIIPGINNTQSKVMKQNKVMESIDKVKGPKLTTLHSDQTKTNYIYSLCALSNNKDLPLTIKMKENMSQSY